MTWFFYNILFVIVMMVLAPKYLWHMRRRGGYRRGFMQRFGRYAPGILEPRPPAAPPRIWVHAVSVGEMLIALRFVEALHRRFPGRDIVLSTNTSTGHALAAQRLPAGDTLVYFPLDLPWIMRRVFNRIDPGLILLMECELWPNLIRIAHRRAVPVVLANARLSDRSFKGYGRLKPLFRRAAAGLSAVYAQSERDAERFRSLGIPAERVTVAGNAKYDLVTPDPDSGRLAAAILDAAGIRPPTLTVMGGSTWPGEEDRLMDLLPRLRQAIAEPVALVLVPRHVERSPDILAAARRRGLTVVTRRESRANPVAPDVAPDVFLVDTTGELQLLYAAATVVFVGKSLDAIGGQNPIEPAAHGVPVIVGPHMENFPGVMTDLRAAAGVVCVKDGGALERELAALLCDPWRRQQLGRQAAAVVQRQRGAVDRSIAWLPPMPIRGGSLP